MKLSDAIQLVAKDTRENTDDSMTDREAIDCARGEVTVDDLDVVDDATLRSAYEIVLAASADDVARALR
ncbi:hypothetical protein ACFORH_43180 [Amycolatopsis roodepoortensis]|uniref:Uncharacterized protein n=1 Tax=Amycolatopsis roodepoortensis TaxID=700274 RepID=A0ABR9LIZ9_9PSEU|nr:hypothetical protein [Amycolatopsis roodepoortensis]MBE1580455.1 hypothetical protein [Amycolatopsis roodepoortensis]